MQADIPLPHPGRYSWVQTTETLPLITFLMSEIQTISRLTKDGNVHELTALLDVGLDRWALNMNVTFAMHE